MFRKFKVGNVLWSENEDAVVMLITSQEDRNSRANIPKPSYQLNKMQAVAGKCVTRNK